MFSRSRFVVGSSKARMPQFKQKVSARARRMMREANTWKKHQSWAAAQAIFSSTWGSVQTWVSTRGRSQGHRPRKIAALLLGRARHCDQTCPSRKWAITCTTSAYHVQWNKMLRAMLTPCPNHIGYNKTWNHRRESEMHCRLVLTNNFNNWYKINNLKIHNLFYFPDIYQETWTHYISQSLRDVLSLPYISVLWSKRHLTYKCSHPHKYVRAWWDRMNEFLGQNTRSTEIQRYLSLPVGNPNNPNRGTPMANRNLIETPPGPAETIWGHRHTNKGAGTSGSLTTCVWAGSLPPLEHVSEGESVSLWF